MPCPEVVESLPELLSGALPEARRAELESHLAGCAACRLEWDETRLGALVFESHVEASVVTALAWERELPGVDLALARQHVDACSECAEDLALARESRAREASSQHAPRPARPAWFGPAALFGMAAAFVGGLLLGSRRAESGFQIERRVAAESAARLSSESDRLRQAELQLRERLAQFALPRLNLPLVELFPATARDASGREPTLTLGSADTLAALVFSTPGAPEELAVELRDEQQRVLWKGTGLRPNPLGGYVLGVPAELLPTGRFTLVVRREGTAQPFASFSFRVRRGL